MEAGKGRRRLIVNADDFGRSRSINEAVRQAHREGILTTASLMVTGDAAEDAVAIARRFPKLGVGLHLTLVCGRAASDPATIPGLVTPDGFFTNDAVAAGMKCFFKTGLREQLEQEIDAQFSRFSQTGLKLDHVNGHLNFHLHPTVFSILMEGASKWGIKAMRLTRDRFWLNARLESGRWLYRISHGVIFSLLAAQSEPQFDRRSIQHTSTVFGLLQNAEVTESYVARLLPYLEGDSELYAHPSVVDAKQEFAALISPRIRRAVEELGIELIRYQDL
jgi:hopanoid biosynthesis associated protein HpnK